MPYMHSHEPSREARKRREREVSLSPRPSTRPPAGAQDRLPSIRTILPDIPHPSSEQTLSQLRSPLQQDPPGSTRSATLPAQLSPSPTSRRPIATSDDSNGPRMGSYQVDDRGWRRTTIEAPPPLQLPIHSGPPHGRVRYSPPTYSPSVPGPAPVSPYATQPEAHRGYLSTAPNSRVRTPESSVYPGVSQSLPPPPTQYRNSVNGHSSYEYDSGRSENNVGYGDPYYADARTTRAPAYPASNAPYSSVQASYPSPPPGSAYYQAPQYSNGYRGSMQFEAEDIGNPGPRRRRGNLPRDTTDLLKSWFSDHLAHPYPTEDEKQMLCRRTGLQMTQISNWFINARRRRIPELMNQATAETRLRENSGDSAGSSE